jgi:hypothetical protein
MRSPEARIASDASRVALYLDNGRRFELEAPPGLDAAALVQNSGLPADRVAAITNVPGDRLRDGVLIGAAAGSGVALGWGYHLAEDDFDRDVAAAALVYGFAAGAGVGALLDAGLAKLEKPLWLRPAPALPASSARRLNIGISPSGLGGWIMGRKVEMMTKDGAYWKGKVLQQSDKSLTLAVSESSIKGQKRKEAEIPLDQIATVFYRERLGGNRFAAALGGGLAGLFIGPLVSTIGGTDAADETRVVAGLGAGLIGGTTAGLALAHYGNRREVTLSIR